MNARDIINLQEAYLEVYSEPEISEEAQIAAEYFYEQGLTEDDVENLIEEIGMDEFGELVNEILESYGIDSLSEASAVQNWFARQILQGMDRHRQATQKLSQSKVGKALGSVERGLTTIGDVGFRAAGQAKQAVGKEIEKVKSARSAKTKSPTSRLALPPSGHTSAPKTRQSSSGRLTNIGRASKALDKAFDASEGSRGKGIRYVGPSSRPTASLPPTRQPLALPPAPTSKTGKTLTSSQRRMQTDAQNKRLKKRLNLPEDFELWVDSLIEEGYDLSEYSWDDMLEIYEANVVMSVTSPEGKSRALNVTKAEPSRNLQGKERLRAARTMRQKTVDTKFKDPRKVAQFRRRHGLPEEFEFILSHLLDEGYAETLESAEAILESMSEEWVSEILDEAQQIMSVSRGGKQIYKTPRSELHRPSNELSSHKQKRMNQLARARRNADRRGEESPARERQFDGFVSGTDTPLNRVRTSNIKKLNAPREFDYHDDPYRTVPTDYRARKRRASGR